MKEICLINRYILTNKDQPNKQALIFFTHPLKCNLYCYCCHNRESANKDKIIYYSFKEFERILYPAKELVDMIIISGGEPLVNNFSELRGILEFIKEQKLNVRLDTNGMSTNFLFKIIEDKLIDGIGLDIKIPIYKDFNNLTKDEEYRYKKILYSNSGIEGDVLFIYKNNIQDILNFINNNKQIKKEFSILRTVKYPLLTKEELSELKDFLSKYDFIYQQNEFIDINK